MTGWRWILATSLAGALVAGQAAAAQWPDDREGMTLLGFNLGAGSAQLRTDQESSDRELGPGFGVRFGYGFSDDFVLSFEGTAWVRAVENTTWTFALGAGALSWFPKGGNFFLRGGAGFGFGDASRLIGAQTQSFSEGGYGFLAATGYEVRFTPEFAFGPQLGWSWIDLGDGTKANYLNLTVIFNWYL